jgi:hypothetical protein
MLSERKRHAPRLSINSGWQNSMGEPTMLFQPSRLQMSRSIQKYLFLPSIEYVYKPYIKGHNIGFVHQFERPSQTLKMFYPERDSGEFENL